MKTKYRYISIISYSLSRIFNPKSVCSIINHFQSMPIRNSLNFFYIAYVSIYMDRNNCHCFFCDQILNLRLINRSITQLHVTKYWF